ncbi:Uncharacterised protein [Sphingobacterium mizutaii]|uniref:Uncharacterized protein n=1 Tax=Sphingobacterium mizutaii TaxID=1010 RepID=A0AAJ4X9B6_9SPHI|nr:hypothetical protein SAMN05192578_10366 [Sphingobacterium mizutaii]SNV43305.1 Uncharacterised protein [Sphingobacterium mizutaii]
MRYTPTKFDTFQATCSVQAQIMVYPPIPLILVHSQIMVHPLIPSILVLTQIMVHPLILKILVQIIFLIFVL